MRFAFIFIAIGLFSAACTQKAPEQNVPPQKRNVYFITATGMKADHLSSYFYQSGQTVGLDYLAYDGVRFTRAFSNSTDSLPAHLSMLTGMYPTRKPIFDTFQYFQTFTETKLPDLKTNLPRFLSEKGYRTAAFIADPDLRSFAIRSNTFDTIDAGDSTLPIWQSTSDSNRLRFNATEWVLKTRNHPHFVFLNFFEPTPPYEPPAPFGDHYAKHPYDGDVGAIDEQVSRFIHSLKQNGIFNHSIVIFTAPYGENPEATGRAGSLEDGNLKIPLMIAAPGILPRQQMYETAVSLADLFPTVLKLLSFKEPSDLDGDALFERNSDHQITHEFLFGGSFFPMQLGKSPSWFVWNDGWKWTSNNNVLKREEGFPLRTTPEQLLQKELQLRAKVKEAITELQLSRTDDADGAVLRLEGVLILARKGNFEDALKQMNEPPLPETPFTLVLRSNLESASGKIDDAHKTLVKALEMSKHPELRLRLASLEINSGELKKAEAILKDFEVESSYDTYNIITIVKRHQGQLDEAQKNVDAALRLNPYSAEAQRQQALIFFDQGEFDQAEKWLKKALEQQPDNPYTILDLATTVARLGRQDEVKSLCAKILVSSDDTRLQERAKSLLSN